MARKMYTPGTILEVGVSGVLVTYEGKTSQLFRIKLEGGVTMFREDPQDLNLYIPDGIQWHRTSKTPQRGTEESRSLGGELAWMGEAVSIQFVGPRTVLVYTDTTSKTRNAVTCALIATRMLEKARSLTNP